MIGAIAHLKTAAQWAKAHWKVTSGTVVAVFVLLLFCSLNAGESVDAFQKRLVNALEVELASPSHAIRKRVEAAHVTVTSTGARVTECHIKTLDGSNRAGKNGSNIREIDMIVTVYWDGVFQKGGYTQLQMILDAQSNTMITTRYVGGNAKFNAETTDWFEVGQKMAPAVFALFAL